MYVIREFFVLFLEDIDIDCTASCAATKGRVHFQRPRHKLYIGVDAHEFMRWNVCGISS